MLTAGADPFRIALGLHPEMVDRLLSQVLSIPPVGRLPDVGGRRFPGPPPRREAGGSGSGSGRAGPRRLVPRASLPGRRGALFPASPIYDGRCVGGRG